MGFWHTGYIEFHEPTGLESSYEPAQIFYHCQHCTARFETTDALLEHRLIHHPYLRPLLFIRGRELGTTPITLSRALQDGEVEVHHCDTAKVNGQPISLTRLGAHLAQFRNDKVWVELLSPNISAQFELLFSVAEEIDCQGIEKNLLAIARQHTLDLRALEIFINTSRPLTTAINYCDGICQYLYGVLAKEQPDQALFNRQDYLNRYVQADETLKDFDRPLARTIRALIAFHFNHFADAAAWMPHGHLGTAARRFAAWIQNEEDSLTQPTGEDRSTERLDRLLSDLDTDQILRWAASDWATLTPHVEHIQKHIQRSDLAEYDRTKLKILLAEYFAAHEQPRDARRIALELIHAPALGDWADQLKNRLDQ